MRKSYTLVPFLCLFLLATFLPWKAEADQLVYSAWIPYWKKTTGIAETKANLSKLKEISPFSYTVSKTGDLVDTLKINEEPWTSLFKEARLKKVKILPSILWSDSLAIDQVLSNSSLRQSHLTKIMSQVTTRNFDGIDIDYENKFASTSPAFSAFIKDLSVELHKKNKTLSCTIEARTPPSSRFLVIPAVLEYANDYPSLNKYCDQIRLMTYDQGTADIKLNMVRRLGGLYYPIADPTWVRKVVELALKDISPSKLVLGVATYGYELEITDKTKFFDYQKVRSLSYKDFQQLVIQSKAKPQRNNAGELSLVYLSADKKIRFASFSDAQSLSDKVRIAQLYNLRGVAIFKIDGESDDYWKLLK